MSTNWIVYWIGVFLVLCIFMWMIYATLTHNRKMASLNIIEEIEDMLSSSEGIIMFSIAGMVICLSSWMFLTYLIASKIERWMR